MRKLSFFLWALLLVDGVFGVEKEEVSVSVMEGDSVTLNPSTEIPEDDTIQWWFGDKSIAQMNKKHKDFSTSEGDRVGFKDRLELDHQTGSLTISNITNTDSGLYKLQIKSRIETFKIFSVSVRGEMKTVSVTEGEPIILYTGVKIQGDDLILWKFEDHLIAEINKGALSHDSSAGGRFKGRLQPSEQYGSLTIRGSRTKDSGDYHLNMSSSSHTVQRSISVTVSVPDKPTPDPGLSPGAVTGIVAVVQMLVFAVVIFAGVIYHRRKISEVKGRKYLEKNGTNDHLKTETDSSD